MPINVLNYRPGMHPWETMGNYLFSLINLKDQCFSPLSGDCIVLNCIVVVDNGDKRKVLIEK